MRIFLRHSAPLAEELETFALLNYLAIYFKHLDFHGSLELCFYDHTGGSMLCMLNLLVGWS